MVWTFHTISSFALLRETCAFDKVISLWMDVGSEVPLLSQYQEWHQKNSQGQLTLKAEACLHIMLLLNYPNLELTSVCLVSCQQSLLNMSFGAVLVLGAWNENGAGFILFLSLF